MFASGFEKIKISVPLQKISETDFDDEIR